MKVKIGNKIYDSNEEPIVIQLTDEIKDLIKSMPDDHSVLLAYPTGNNSEEMRDWAKELKIIKP